MTFATGVGLIVTDPDVVVPPEELGVVADCVSTAVLTMAPDPTVTSTVICSCRTAPFAIEPTVQVTTLSDSVTLVPFGAAPLETKPSPAGSESTIETPAAAPGPLLSTVRV